MKYALIDTGSNSIRLTVYDMDRTSFKVLFKEKIMAGLALFAGRQLQKAVSVPVGALKLYRDCVKKILPGKESRRRIEETIQTAFDSDALKEIPCRDHMVCVGGTARASLRLCKGGKDAADLILRYEPERIHTLVPGIMLLRYLADRFGVEDITVSHYGVREGYLRRKIQPSRLMDQI